MIQLDIKEFYPCITEKSLNNAITFAENYISISKDDNRIIKHCRKTTFDVTMGSYDGEELCELIGIYIQSLLTNIISKDKMGLYRDDGLFILRRKNKQKQIEYEGKL